MPTYRLTAATFALFPAENGHVARTIPQGTVVRVNALNANKFVEVVWGKKTALMLTEDLAERAERVVGEASSSAA